ncbi:MAG: GGDEF domain-containing protein [Thermoanaerobaculia bacterium]
MRELLLAGLVVLGVCGWIFVLRLLRALRVSKEESARLGDRTRKLEKRIEESTGQLERIAGTDELTGILNRRSLMQRGDAECSRAQRHEHPVSLLLLEVDDFQQTSAAFGKELGDRALKAIADNLVDSVREHDVLGRYGDDEFVLVLPHAGEERAIAAAERLRLRIGQMRLPSPSGEVLPITASLAVAVLHRRETFQEALRRAEAAVKESRTAGRDRVQKA